MEFLITLLGLSVANLINAKHSDKIAAIEKKISTLRNKNDAKSQATLNKVNSLLQSNNQLAMQFPRYMRILNKDNNNLRRIEQNEIDRHTKTASDLDALSIKNQNRHNLGIENKLFSNNDSYDKEINNINLNNFEKEI